MSGKKVSIGTKPSTGATMPIPADAWVENRTTGDALEPTKRLTIDVPASLHRAIKTSCAMRGTKIADEVRNLLIEKYVKVNEF